jgi:hypothetical protein
MPRCRTREVMVPGGCRELAWSIPYLEVQDLVQDLVVQHLEVRAVSRSKRRLQIDAMPFRDHGPYRLLGRCEFSSGAAVLL